MVKLVKYEAARRAIAAAAKVDEVKNIRDQAMAMKLYAQLARDEQMQRDAEAIRRRAERRLGQLMQEQAKTVGKAKGGDKGGKRPIAGFRKNPANAPPTLAEAGIDKRLAHRARQLAAIAEEKFEAGINELRNPPPKPDKPKPRRSRPVYVHEFPPPRELFFMHVEQAELAAEAAIARCADIAVDVEMLAAARRVIKAWTECINQMEGRHGEKVA